MERWFGSSLLVCVVMWCCSLASPGSGLDSRLNRIRRSIHCADELEYRHNNLCCKNCPAGTHMKSPCTRSGARGECEECGLGTYTDFGNGLRKCLSCSVCRPDQEVVRACESTHNTECQCKPGGFCAPDQACEVCKRCARCGKDEIVVRNCTATTNTECKKKPADPEQDTDWTALSVTLGLAVPLAVLVFLLVFCVHWRRRKAADSGRSQGDLASGFSGTEKSNGASPRCWTLVDEPEFNVVPVKGEASLRSCFEFFEELLDFNYHSRFFRHLGLTDNQINSKISLSYVDRVHDLLNLWLEKRGKEASLKDLLKALMDLNQRRTAEVIVEKAVEAGYYVRQ